MKTAIKTGLGFILGKVCSSCKEKKSLSNFYKNSNKRGGLYNACKNCHNRQVVDSRIRKRELSRSSEALTSSGNVHKLKKDRSFKKEKEEERSIIKSLLERKGKATTRELSMEVFAADGYLEKQKIRDNICVLRRNGEEIVNVNEEYQYQNYDNALLYERKMINKGISHIASAQGYTLRTMENYPELQEELQKEIGRLTIFALTGKKSSTSNVPLFNLNPGE